jgi:hypothetical protein
MISFQGVELGGNFCTHIGSTIIMCTTFLPFHQAFHFSIVVTILNLHIDGVFVEGGSIGIHW